MEVKLNVNLQDFFSNSKAQQYQTLDTYFIRIYNFRFYTLDTYLFSLRSNFRIYIEHLFYSPFQIVAPVEFSKFTFIRIQLWTPISFIRTRICNVHFYTLDTSLEFPNLLWTSSIGRPFGPPSLKKTLDT